jgi:hypothetical protein
MMRLRQVPVGKMRTALTLAEEEKIPVTLDQLEAHHCAGGNVEKVLQAVLKARGRGLPDNVMRLFAVDLAGEDLDTFVERGCVTESELRLRDLQQKAGEDLAAAEALHKELSELLKGLDQTAQQLKHPPPFSGRKTIQRIREQVDLNRQRLQEDLAELEARWPVLGKRKGTPAA